MICAGRVLWLIFISTCLVAPAFSMLALSVAGAQTTLDKRQPMLMTAYKWASLTERQRQIYIRGFLETVSFLLYGHSQKDNKEHAKIFSEWTMCAERQPLSSWQTLGWTLRSKTDETVAAQFYDIAAEVCKDSAGKGDGSWRAVWLLKPQEWKSLSLNDRAIYLMAYLETVYAATRRAKDAANERKLDICIASVGIEGLISSMEQTKIEWQFPLPWSASRALGSACKAQGN
jgi:hypothetical protein